MLWPLVLVWAAVIAIVVAGVQKGIGAMSVVFIPLLVLAFLALVVRSLFLPGAADGLDALFTPNWDALADAGVWAAAFGQIFFSLSVGFGIMITYASYVGRKTDMTGSGLVVGLANSSFELLAGIGVFAALGFMAQASGAAVDEVATSGLGLAFVAFPAIISEAPAGALIGVLFFASLVVAGLTSLVSVIEVVISAVRDKLDLGRTAASLAVGLPAAGRQRVAVRDHHGGTDPGHSRPLHQPLRHLVGRRGQHARRHLGLPRSGPPARPPQCTGSVPLGSWWLALVGVVTPAALSYVLSTSSEQCWRSPYGGYPDWLVSWIGWGSAVGVVVLAVVLARLPWRRTVVLSAPPEEASR